MRQEPHPEIHRRFSLIFKALGLTQKEFGENLGLSHNQVSTILSGKSNITSPTIHLLRHVFRVNPDFILKGDAPMFLPPKREHIPILSAIPPGDWRQWIDAYEPGTEEGYLDVSTLSGESLFAVRMPDVSMEPAIHAGDILVIDPGRRFSRGVAVVRRSRGYTVRTVREFGNRYVLVAYNPDYPEEEIEPDGETVIYVPVKIITVRDV